MAVDDLIEKEADVTLPKKDPLVAKSLSQYVDLITRSHSGKWNTEEEKQRSIITGTIMIKDILEHGKVSEDLIDRAREYMDFVINRPNHRRVSRINNADFIFYRGQSNIDFNLAPSIFRNNPITNHSFLKNEDGLYHEMIVRCPEYFRGTDHLDKLVIMQHFGMCTRLLDITSNPLVALYFACLPYKDKEGNETDGRVFIFGLKKDQLLYADSDRVLMHACIPELSYNVKMRMLQTAFVNMKSEKFPFKKGSKAYYDEVEQLYREVRREAPAFERKIHPVDLLAPVFVKPSKANPRILKQDGAFIISGLDENGTEATWKINQHVYVWITIPAKSKKLILHELDLMGINKASLFPDLENTAAYLKEQI